MPKAAMTSRERVLTTCAHKEPDRVPIDFGGRISTLHAFAERDLKRYLGLDGGEERILSWMTYTVDPDPRLVERFGRDTTAVPPRPGSRYTFRVDPETSTYKDEWGIKYYMPPGGFYFDPCEHPLAWAEAPSDLDRFDWPDPTDPSRIEGVGEALRAAREAGYATMLTAPTLGVWLLPHFLCGMERALMDLALNRPFVEALAERLTEWYEAFWTVALEEVGPWVDLVHMEGDLGDQTGPLFSPRVFREIYKPRFRRIVDVIKRHSSACLWLHSCGSVRWAIPDLIDCGVDVLNPVQVGAAGMDSFELKRDFGRDLAFWGGGCDTKVLQFGTPSEVEAEVKRRVEDFKPGGGYVFASIHNIQANVPPENIVAMFDAARRYGVY